MKSIHTEEYMAGALYYVTSDEITAVLPELRENGFVGEIDFACMHSDDDYLNTIAKVFRFPKFKGQTGYSWDSYFDWMTDLSWGYDAEWTELTRNGYSLVIYNCDINGYTHRYNDLLKKIIDSFVYKILPWWTKDIESCVVDGKPKDFNVYLVI